jgi:hypothetical protein
LSRVNYFFRSCCLTPTILIVARQPLVPGVPLYAHGSVVGVTQPGTIRWLNPNAFLSTVDPRTGACVGGDTLPTCQFGNLGRNALRGHDFTWSDLYLTKWFALTATTPNWPLKT